jgi:hypothetical protein
VLARCHYNLAVKSLNLRNIRSLTSMVTMEGASSLKYTYVYEMQTSNAMTGAREPHPTPHARPGLPFAARFLEGIGMATTRAEQRCSYMQTNGESVQEIRPYPLILHFVCTFAFLLFRNH